MSRDLEPGFRLVVLGIAQDAGYPHAGCRGGCCRAAWSDPSRRRGAAALGLYEPRTNARWIFEATPDLPAQLNHLLELSDPGGARRRPVLDGVFLTHAHIGHYVGLVHLGRESMGTTGVPVFAMPRMGRFLAENGPWSQLVDLGNIRVETLVEEQAVELRPELRVVPISVPHRGEFSETVAFRIEGPRRRVLFLPDVDRWEHWDRDLAAVVGDCDLAYLDGTFFGEDELPRERRAEIPHPTVRATMDRLDAAPPEVRARVRFLHLNHTNPLLQVESPAREEIRRRGYHCAEEGEQFVV